MSYMFVNPLDEMPMSYDSLDEATKAAAGYIGVEGMDGPIKTVVIFETRKVCEVQ